MRALPLSIGPLHFVGIGGIGMSGIAEVLHELGYQVQGSDIAENANVARLRKAGISVAIGHDAKNLGAAQVVVISTAVPKDNPEVLAARRKLIPVVRRAEMLAELMRLKWAVAIGGTHGKTTTTSLVAAVLEGAGFDPTVINGGIINAYGSNTRLGTGDWMVVEADESDGSFLRLPAVIAIVTNMDPEHLDHWHTKEAMEAGVPAIRLQHSVLRLRGAVHRPSGGAADDPVALGSSCRSPTGFRRRRMCGPSASSPPRMVPASRCASPTASPAGRAGWGRSSCRCWATTMCRTRWRRSPWRRRWRSTSSRSRRRWPISQA